MTRARAVLHGDEYGQRGPGRYDYVSAQHDDDQGTLPLGPEGTRSRVKYNKTTRGVGWEMTFEVTSPGSWGDDDFDHFQRDALAVAKRVIDNIPAMVRHHAEMEARMQREQRGAAEEAPEVDD